MKNMSKPGCFSAFFGSEVPMCVDCWHKVSCFNKKTYGVERVKQKKEVEVKQTRSPVVHTKKPKCFGSYHLSGDNCTSCVSNRDCHDKTKQAVNRFGCFGKFNYNDGNCTISCKHNNIKTVRDCMVQTNLLKSQEEISSSINSEVEILRNSLVQLCEQKTLSSRYKVSSNHGKTFMTIVDTHTGRKSDVPLYAYSAVRQTLKELFEI